MLTPSRTAASARAQSSSSTCSRPAAPKPAWKVVSSVRDLKWVSAISEIERIFSRSASVRIGWRTSRRLCAGHALQVEQVRPRPDDRDQAHDQLLADRIDRRIGDLREILLEVGEQRLRLVRQRRDRRVVAHRAVGLFAGGGHRRHQDVDVFLRIAERLLPVQQRQVGAHALGRRVRQFLQHDLGAVEPLAIGMALRQLRLDLVVGNEAALFEVDQQHLAGLQSPLGDDVLLGDLQHAHFRGHDDAVVAR